MQDKLYWNTVTPMLRNLLETLMDCPLFNAFRLVGGTSLSLQLGHRESVDIDLFTDFIYGSVDFPAIDSFLRQHYRYAATSGSELIGFGQSYLLTNDQVNFVKLDIYYTDTFIQSSLIVDNIRMATIEEIIAMKIDIIQRAGRKKDFWDVHELIDTYSLQQMIALHKARYPYTHDEALIRKNIIDFSLADDEPDPICLKGNYWEIIKLEIIKYANQLH